MIIDELIGSFLRRKRADVIEELVAKKNSVKLDLTIS